MGRRPTRAWRPQGLSNHKDSRPARRQQTRAKQGRKGTRTTILGSPHGNAPHRDSVEPKGNNSRKSPQGIYAHKGRMQQS
ncbi:uncharacterized protein K452DRAFT_292187 [Aplosporella prunicola CBS 121167]|uniref:Uncharacterized protein n=1 Tax=Aplosporella prunicola CBS 121167 TaxID=1176127 RepID=A0A6A6B0B4_9PEZI|nr:uncharacterized protein K452DRAFT_292187 [Aplosporella prunicola CBS 121167]KAF2136665.1 hypothetical protein K452DRAFT_292187 [Aplosporella prunicola CBS 121167]